MVGSYYHLENILKVCMPLDPMNYNFGDDKGKDICIYENISPCDGYDTSETPQCIKANL